jgi:hypothetical protein
MAPKRAAKPGASATYYKKNPEARKKKAAYDTAYHSSPERRKYRAELARERRRRGIMGKGGSDVSHTTNGGTKLESARKNRARNGTSKGRPKSVRRGTKA